MAVAAGRTRDPDRKEKILRAAADLVARNGFHSVSMSDIGSEAGITGSGIYRHFDGKSSILVALFDLAMDDLRRQEREILDHATDLGQALSELIDGQVEFAVGSRQLAQVYYNEIRNLPDEDQVRLRRKQRLYLEEWVHIVRELHPDLDDAEARAIVHAAIGAIQSTLFHNVGLPADRLRVVLTRSARSVLGLNP
ncbi:MAG: TetR/AcrR family transcriptional regulator [Actinomycetota bacterium]|jgi:AcrR family transcriptional regulator|nr:TetR/AcrR family transcriptional regulator [Actinomycetota bacterium]